MRRSPTAGARTQLRTEQLWQVRARGSWWACYLRFLGESRGWEVRIERDGAPFGGHRHLLRADALKWADEMKAETEKGWPE
jgi:hypothetical protein